MTEIKLSKRVYLSGIFLSLVLSMLAGCGYEPGSPISVHVAEVLCNGGGSTDGLCNGKKTVGGDLEFRLNAAAHSGVIIVNRMRQGGWFVHTEFLPHCIIVDSENWRCTVLVVPHKIMPDGSDSGLDEIFEMKDGHYARRAATVGTTDDDAIPGLSGFRYWWWKWTGVAAQ